MNMNFRFYALYTVPFFLAADRMGEALLEMNEL